ncbi:MULTISPECIES: rhomboid family intramembrane serine protease [unclassified Polaribacter]|uniref:rhomboid family intramembrane serine protease n=1 Tax=unclassified Polaribacter TaxID=196858 RepID=UPI0011BD57DF|nr:MULTISPECIES: rhomboid family intramembrane serine protease [unclassified Polaribacter]TXD54294.1 rhomboid family intramembrane serine protease [Polaribacter sp. IC063]TXD62875.1 rhomboid family intramembrane serine protease [Polaribacter sp. IC066]
MSRNQKSKLKSSIFLIPVVYIIFIWVVYWVEIQFGYNFNKFGVFPRTLKGFRGVFFTHFIHGDIGHLFNNSIPLFVLLCSLFYFYKEVAYKVLFLGAFLTGFLTWVIARDSYHIGASGVVYLLFSFVFFSGIIRKHFRLVAVSFIVIFLYGGMVWYVLPIKDGISWEGHLCGFFTGFIFAFIYKNIGTVKKEHQFTTTEFDLLFDENGNFSPPKNEDIKDGVEAELK